jgi:8-oxo-dGTP pyrophosphatase MutT (NUDIX family)
MPADYDYGRDRPKQKNVTITPHDFRSRSAAPVRDVGNYADNAMVDPAKLNEDGDMLDRLYQMVSPLIKDEDILGGVSLTEKGFQKAAGRLGISPDETRMLFNSLKTKIKRERDLTEQMMNELKGDTTQRYSYEKDSLGTVTVRDAETGAERFYRGDSAANILHDLSHGGNTQAILAKYVAMTESDGDPHHAEHDRVRRETGFYGKAGSGCIVIAKSTGRILIAHRSADVEQPHTWGGWGGAIDPGLSPIQNALKEIVEEAGFQGEILEKHELYTFKAPTGTFRYFNYLLVVEDEFKPRLNWESQNYKWVKLGVWPQPLHFGLKALFADAPSMSTIKAVIAKCGKKSKPVRESVEIIDEDDNFESEIRQSSSGSYNFPWTLGSQEGFGNFHYRFVDDKMVVKLRVVTDKQGNDIMGTLSPEALAKIKQQAIDYIGHE